METKPQTPEQTDYQPPTEEDEAEAPPAEAASPGVQENRIVPAKVVRVTETHAIVDFGWKSEGQVPLADFKKDDGAAPAVAAGDALEVLVESLGESDGKLVLSKEKADKVRRWDAVVARCAKGGPVQGTVVAKVSGGFSVDIGVRAFLPANQADVRRVGDPDSLIGETFEFGVAQVDKRRGNIVLTRKALLQREMKQKKAETLAKLAEGAVLPGVVKTLTDYGAFVDLGGIDGLLHVSDLSWGRVGRPSEVLQPGQAVEVKVLKWDPATERISLGLKQLRPDPWSDAAGRLAVGTKVKGRVTSLTEYGAFVELTPGLEGLVHVSEMSWTRRVKPSQVLKVGDPVDAVVLDLDPKARRIGLGMKQLAQNPWTLLEEQYPIGSVIRSQVRSVTDFGIFLGVLEGIDGLVHISDLSWTRRVKHPGELYKKGDEVEAVVLNIDAENERFSLGIKQLKPDPWTEFARAHPIGSKLKGKVTRVVDFGAFVEVEPDIEGLVHVSELRDERVENPAEVVKAGDQVEVRLLDVDAHQHKASLSLRAAQNDPDDYRSFMNDDKSGRASFGEVFGEKLKK